MLLVSDRFATHCEDATVYLDTNVFIYAQDQEELLRLVGSLLKDRRTAFVTLSSVEYEYSRGSRTLDELRVRREFVRALASNVLPVGKLLESDKNDAFSAVMSIVYRYLKVRSYTLIS